MKHLHQRLSRPLGTFLMCVASLIAALSSAYADEDPSALIKNTSEQIKALLMTEDGSNTAAIRIEVEKILEPRFDFLRMTAYALGRPWRSASAEQKEVLIEEFRNLLTGTYFNTLLRYRDAEITIKPDVIVENKGKEATVKSRVAVEGMKDPVAIDYVLYKSKEGTGWKVFNINVEGASLITVYRNQFGQEISKHGIDGLIQTLKDKNNKIKK